MTAEKEDVFYSPDKVKKGDLSLFKFVWIVTIELKDEVNPIEIEIILN
jgi:hypothetical protein